VDLPQIVADRLGIDRTLAERGLSALFMSIRMAVDPTTFSKVTTTLPDADSWMRGIGLMRHRTGEIIGLAGPEALARTLKAIGYDDAGIQNLGGAVGNVLHELLPQDAFDKITSRVPLLKESHSQ
jgi:hypothetical protein